LLFPWIHIVLIFHNGSFHLRNLWICAQKC
jgi:hypothetical protein